jgi:ABC-type proline/glycine betaine transport system permease subunit
MSVLACLALIVGVPLGVWTANSPRAEKILRPVLDLMQTMPAFVYLIPAVLFFGLLKIHTHKSTKAQIIGCFRFSLFIEADFTVGP